MLIKGEVDISVIQRHEETTASNARLGYYHMDCHCPTNEFRCFRVGLEQQDEDNLFLLGLTEFVNQTQSQSCRLRDVVRDASSIRRVESFITARLDLRSGIGLELVLVGSDLHGAPLVIIDGNHRAIAQYLTHGSVDGVPAFVCVHPAIRHWPFVPPLAQKQRLRTKGGQKGTEGGHRE